MRSIRDASPALLAGAFVSVALWLSDLLRLSGYAFAGVSDPEAADRVLAVTESAVFSLEAKLLAVHAVLGLLSGALAHFFLRSFPSRNSRLREILLSAVLTFLLAVLALFGMVGTYPQLFADRFWLSGGLLARLQRLITHGIGPGFFDAALVVVLLAALTPPAVLGLRRLLDRQRREVRKIAVAASVLCLVAFALEMELPQTSAEGDPQPVNVLILASDSLRSDRIEDPEVMPFTASRLAEGSLYRYAVTPIARTYPAWVSTLTGTEPRKNGIRHMFPTVASRREVGPTLFTELRDRGYFTFAASDFAGDVFPGFEAGFELTDTPHLNVDTLAQSTVLTGHTWSLALLRLRAFRELFPYWRNVPALADPEWVVDATIRHLSRARERPFAGLVFFSTAHFPYAAPYPHYKKGSGDYRGRYLYHVPPVQPEEAPDREDVAQIRARYDAALTAIDRAMERLMRHLEDAGLDASTLVVVTGDHGEEFYESEGIAGHGDTLRYLRSQAVPIFLSGPGVARGVRSSAQVRLYDLPATILDLAGAEHASGAFGHGRTLLDTEALRPVCVETGIWFWPGRPLGLRGRRLDYPGIAELLEMAPSTREMVLRAEMENLVESAKERGLVLGRRLYREQLTPGGLEKEVVALAELEPAGEDRNLASLFEKRCVAGDDDLHRLYGAVVFERERRPGP